ncbi:MAG TPA: hypothetical protein DCZ23_07740 [Lachnospiraceae bacterium]|nr:hypothetical protein [Lachnospiraceae bacterium]
MKEKKWQRFAVQSIALLAVVLALSVFRQGGFVRNNGKKVMADGTVITKELQEAAIEETEEAVKTDSVKTDITHVKKRSHTYIEIPKSAVTTGAGVYLYDIYMNSEVRLTIDGMAQKGFSQNSIARYTKDSKVTGKVYKKNKKDIVESFEAVSVKNKDGTYKTDIKIKTKQLYAPELYETDSSYYISLAVPGDIYDKIIVIDAGHGGTDEGTRSAKGHSEKDYNLIIVKELKNLLDSGNFGIKVYYTRLSDKKVSRPARTALANNLDADLFVSIHCNSSEYGEEEPYGVEALYSKRKPRNSKLSNKKLAKILLENVAEKVNNRKRGVIRREGLYIMHHSNVPAAIIEIGYMSNKSDLKYIIRKSGQKKAAEGIYNGIMEALE